MYIKNIFFLTFLVLNTFSSFAQKRGINNDPNSKGNGERPYEMIGRTEAHKPLVTFEDCSKWIVETVNAEAELYRTDEKPLFRDYTGKLVYTPTSKKCDIILKYEKPVEIPGDWDCIDFWNYGDHWLWGKPDYRTAFRYYVIIEDADGKIHEIDFSQAGYKGLVHQYWFLNHIKLNGEIKLPAKFIGIKFKGRHAIVGETFTIYLGPVYFYKEELKPLKFKELPKQMPFPVSKNTILPENKQTLFENLVEKTDDGYLFIYKDNSSEYIYKVTPEKGLLAGLTVEHNGKIIPVADDGGILFSDGSKAKWNIREKSLSNDTLKILAEADGIDFSFSFTIKQKSLIMMIRELDSTGHVKEVNLGSINAGKESKKTIIPFLSFGNGRTPFITSTSNLFLFKMVDWYYTDASDIIIRKGITTIKYIPKTNGERNPVKEKIFFNVSEDVQEVLPTVSNPKSPMQSMMAHRLWMVDGSADYPKIREYVKLLRTLGLQHVAVRYHEGFWRDEGESYTFRTETAPKRGGNEAVKKLVEYIKSQGWLTGLYSNYTDLAPVNKNWNPDWVLREENGAWQISWSRCYAPKPVVAWEQEAIYAPRIHKEFGTNFSYCDVHTAVSPIDRVDYDYRVPGAAKFRQSYEYYGLLLLNEKKAYHGPVFSEGNYQWMYAGLTDGNYANAVMNIRKTPVFPDFQLLKVHPLEMDAGNVHSSGHEYLAYTLAYGHIGIINGALDERIRRYAILQPLQRHYSMVPVTSIEYFDNGKFYNASEAIKKDLITAPKLALEYQSGLKVFVNFSDETWELKKDSTTYYLPKFGYLVYSDSSKVLALYGKSDQIRSGSDVYYSESSYQYYFDSESDSLSTNDFTCKGNVFLKNEKFGWEIIPATDFDYFSFNPAKLGLPEKVQIEGLNIHDLPVDEVKYSVKDGKIYFEHKNKDVLKYRISPL
jgi:hypothetical protein